MKTKIWKILGVVASFAMVLSLAVTAVPVAAATQAWSKVAMPATASGTDVGPIVVGSDGAIYAAVGTDTPTTYDIVKSTDGGFTWEETRFVDVANAVIDIAVSPDGTIYVAAAGPTLYKVTASSCQPLSLPSAVTTINGVDVFKDGGTNYVLIAADDVYVLEDTLFGAWRDMQLGATAYWAGFAPDFATSNLIWAVYSDGTDTYITATTSAAPAYWNTFVKDIKITGFAVNAKSDVVFPTEYSSDGNLTLFAALNGTGATAIYRCQTFPSISSMSSTATAANIPTGVTNISNLVYTPTAIYAGVGNSATVIRSLDYGTNFAAVTKSPTGASATYVAVLPGGAVVAATSGTESAFSSSADGATFNQISYIDTTISSIVDVAFSPTNKSALMLTVSTTNTSLWRTLDRTASTIFWERVALNTTFTTTDPQLVEYSLDGAAAFWYNGAAGGVIQRSADNAQSFATTLASWTIPATATLNDWVMPDANHIYAALSTGVVWGNQQNIYYFQSVPVVTGAALASIDLEGDALVVGTSNGKVFYSANKGLAGTWKDVTTGSGLTGNTYVAFAEGSDVMVYATAGTALARLTDASADAADLEWVTVVSDGTYTLNAADAIVTAPGAGNTYEGDGMAYVTDFDDEVLRVRGVGPEATGSPAYESIGAPTGASALKGIWCTTGSNVLWSIATTGIPPAVGLWTYTDVLNVSGSGVEVTDVQTVSSYGGFMPTPAAVSSATISFDALAGATHYTIAINTTPQTNFYTASSIGTITWTQTSAPGADTITGKVGGLASGTTYYVSVWADTPVSSFLFGGEPVSFTTPPAAPGVVEPFISPRPGAVNVPINPTFQWMEVSGADHYEFQISTDPSFAGAETVEVDGIFYAVEGLDYETAYYWRVRAVMPDDSASTWVASVFSTMAEPVPPTTVTVPPVTSTVTNTVTPPAQTVIITTPGPTQTVTPPAQTVIITTPGPAVTVTQPPQTIQPAETPTYVWAIVGIGAVLVIAIIVLIIRTRRVA